LIALPYDHNDLDEGQNPHQATEGRYTIVWNVDEDAVFNNTKTIEVTVTWMDHGVEKHVSMQYVKPRII